MKPAFLAKIHTAAIVRTIKRICCTSCISLIYPCKNSGSMSKETNIILDKDGIERKMRRMALEIAEKNHGEPEVILAGIAGNGVAVAKRLSAIMQEMTGMKAALVTVSLNK